MSELSRFQDAFAEALAGDAAPLAPWTEAAERLAVYRNTVAKGCADALAAQFATVARVAGEGWMGEAAATFARAHPPTRPALMDYGEAFPDWLAGFEPAADMPFLAGLARIDWARREALFDADATPLGPDAVATLLPDAYETTALALHPAAQVLWFEDGTPGLWIALQADEASAEAALGAEPEGLLIVRPALAIGWRTLGRGAYAFLEACGRGESLAAAGAAALAAEPDLALGPAFAELLAAGAFSGLAKPRAAIRS